LPLTTTSDYLLTDRPGRSKENSQKQIYKSMARPAKAIAPAAANSLLAAPVYLATPATVLDAPLPFQPFHVPEAPAAPVEVASGVLAPLALPVAEDDPQLFQSPLELLLVAVTGLVEEEEDDDLPELLEVDDDLPELLEVDVVL